LALGDGRQDEVGQQFLVPSFERGAIDRQAPDGTSPVQRYPDHPTADLDFDRLIRQIPLQLLQPALHLLAQLEKLLKIGHYAKSLQRLRKVRVPPTAPQPAGALQLFEGFQI